MRVCRSLFVYMCVCVCVCVCEVIVEYSFIYGICESFDFHATPMCRSLS